MLDNPGQEEHVGLLVKRTQAPGQSGDRRQRRKAQQFNDGDAGYMKADAHGRYFEVLRYQTHLPV